MCYCDSADDVIRRDLEDSSVPDDALVRPCCWEQICRVRGLHPNAIDAEPWRELCRKRSQLAGY